MKKVHTLFAVVLMLFLSTLAFSAEEGLIGYWNFDEGKGDVANDSSENENHGTIG